MKTLFLARCARTLVLAMLLLPATSEAGFFVQNGRLLDDNGNPFVMRGINYPFAWFTQRYPTQTQQDFVNMRATGANTVRIVLGTGAQYTRSTGPQISQLIQWCKDNQMIAVLEVHDSTGWSEAGTAVPISNAVAYWTSADVRTAINGQEDFVIINIANEPFGNNTTSSYVNDTISAITSLRNAGLTHNIMIDGANWGQDWSNTMRGAAPQIFNADPQRNLTFSVHMYEVYPNLSTISTYMQAFATMGLPLVVGEFGPDHNGQPVDEASIMAQAQQRGLGYLGWSWSGNGSCCTQLDLVTNFSTSRTSWGNILFAGANGITQTSVPATVFGPATSTLSVTPASIAFPSQASNALATVTANVTWSVSDNASWLSTSPTAGSNNGTFTVSATANTSTASRSGTVTVSGGGLQRTISVTQSGTAQQQPPAAPAGLAATPGNAQVVLNWNASTGATSYNVKRATVSGGPYTNVGTGITATTFTNSTGLTNGTTYFYVVSAVNANGESTNSAQVSATPQATGGDGGVTVTRVVGSSSGWFNEEQVRIANTSTITALSITIVIQRTPGVSFQGMWNTVGGQIQQSNSSTTSAVTYQFTLAAGQSLSPSTNRQFVAQAGGNGTAHPTSGDTYTVTYTTGGVQRTQSGTF